MCAEQVAVSTNKEVDAQMPNYQSLPAQLICQLHNVTMHVSCLTSGSLRYSFELVCEA